MTDLITLPEYAKGLEKTDVRRPVIETFASSSDLLEVLPFEGMTGSSYEFHRQAARPTVGFRRINEGGTSGMGRLDPYSEASYLIDHDLDVDAAIVRRSGEGRRSREEAMGISAIGALVTDTIIEGDNSSDPKEFNGLKVRAAAVSGRVMHNSAASGGAALSLLKLDSAINNTFKPTHIIAPYVSQPLFIGAARNTAISGFVIQSWDEVGKVKMSYAGLPILWGYPRDLNTGILPFTEVASGGGSAVTTSLFVARLGDQGLRGIQQMPMTVKDKGELEDGITLRTHLSWDIGLVDEHTYCLTRLTSITNAAIVA